MVTLKDLMRAGVTICGSVKIQKKEDGDSEPTVFYDADICAIEKDHWVLDQPIRYIFMESGEENSEPVLVVEVEI